MKFFNFFLIFKKDEKKKFLFISFFLLITIFLEMVSLGLVIPFFSIILDYQGNVFLNNLINYIQINEKETLIIISATFLVSTYLLKNILIYLFNATLNKFTTDIRARISSDIFFSYINKPYSFFLDKKKSHLINDISIEVPTFINSYLAPCFVIISEGLFLFALIVLIFLFSNSFVIIFVLLIVIFVLIFFNFIKTKLKILGEKRQIFNQNILDNLTVGLQNIKEAKIFGAENFFHQNFDKNIWFLSDVEKKNMNFLIFPKHLFEVISILFLCIFVIIMTKSNISAENIIISLAFFGAVGIRVIPLINRIVSAFQRIRYGKKAFQTVLFNIQQIKNDPIYKKQIEVKNYDYKKINNLTFNDVSFQINQHKILERISLNLKSGDILGVKGESGSGKSTLVNLIFGFLKPTKGDILIDKKIYKNNLDILKNKTGYASNNPAILDTTLENNISYGRKYNQEKIDRVIELSQLVNVQKQLDGKKIGDDGNRLSEGQKQRIGIARALYDSPELIILDEATNALDENNESKILNKLKNINKGDLIIILISHKKFTLSFCKKIYDLDTNSLQTT